VLKRFRRVFHRLFGVFVSGQVILFVVMGSGCAVGVGSQFVKLGRSLVRIPRHKISCH
jgi:uncharacterized iron-regulated membrane protein